MKKKKNINDLITSKGNSIPTKKTILAIKKYGFKTISFPVTWMNFMDKSGNVSSDWMLRVKELIEWIINLDMYCILNLQHDGTLKKLAFKRYRIKR